MYIEEILMETVDVVVLVEAEDVIGSTIVVEIVTVAIRNMVDGTTEGHSNHHKKLPLQCPVPNVGSSLAEVQI